MNCFLIRCCLSTWRSTASPLAPLACSALNGAIPWGRPSDCLTSTYAGPSPQQHHAYASGRPPVAAFLQTAAAAAAAAPRQASGASFGISHHAGTGGEAAADSSIRHRGRSQGSRQSDTPEQHQQQRRQQRQQQQPPHKWTRWQLSNGMTGNPATSQVSPARLTGLIKQQTSLADLQDLVQRNSSILDGIHVNAALQWLVVHFRGQPRDPKVIAALVEQWMAQVAVDQLLARNCASLAYYCGKLGYVEDLGLYRGLLQRFMVVKGEAAPQAVSNLLYALASQEQLRSLLEQDVLVTLLQQLAQVSDAIKPQDVSNALWAAAKVEPKDSPQLEDVVAHLLEKFQSNTGDATPQAVANTLYALALLPRAWPMDSALQLVERLVQLLPRAQPQDVSNVLWALGRYAEQGWLLNLPKQSMTRVMAAATEVLRKLSPRATQGRPGGSRPVVNGQDLSNACWGVAKLQQLGDAPPGQQHQPWQAPFSTAVQEFACVLPLATSQAVANTLWACAEVRHYPRRLLQELAGLMPRVQQANAQNVANLAWALAVLAPDPPPAALMAFLLQRLQELLAQQPPPADLSPQHLANTAWAVAVLDQQQLAGQLAPLAAAAFSQQRWPTSQAEALGQWHQVHLWLTDTQVLGPAGLGAVPGVTQQQLEQYRAAWEERLTREAKASDVQKEVAQVLSSMPGVTVVGLEQRDQHDGSRSLDIVARYKGQLVAVEVDGPQHFTWPGQRHTGDTLARNRALERRGYRVVSVPVDPGWAQQRGKQQQQRYLQALLDRQPTTATSAATTSNGSGSRTSPQQTCSHGPQHLTSCTKDPWAFSPAPMDLTSCRAWAGCQATREGSGSPRPC